MTVGSSVLQRYESEFAGSLRRLFESCAPGVSKRRDARTAGDGPVPRLHRPREGFAQVGRGRSGADRRPVRPRGATAGPLPDDVSRPCASRWPGRAPGGVQRAGNRMGRVGAKAGAQRREESVSPRPAPRRP